MSGKPYLDVSVSVVPGLEVFFRICVPQSSVSCSKDLFFTGTRGFFLSRGRQAIIALICNYTTEVSYTGYGEKKSDMSAGPMAFGSYSLACNPPSDRDTRSYETPPSLVSSPPSFLNIHSDSSSLGPSQ